MEIRWLHMHDLSLGLLFYDKLLCIKYHYKYYFVAMARAKEE